MFILDMFALDCQMLGKVGVYGSLVGGGGDRWQVRGYDGFVPLVIYLICT